MKHTITFENDNTGKFSWEVPEGFARYLFCSSEEIDALPTEEMRETARYGDTLLQESVQEAILIHLCLVMHTVMLGIKLNRPEHILNTMQATRKIHLGLMES